MAFLSVDNPRKRVKLVNELDRLKRSIKKQNVEHDLNDISYADATEKLFKPVIKGQEEQFSKFNAQNEERLQQLVNVSNNNQRMIVDSIGDKLKSIGFSGLQAIEQPKPQGVPKGKPKITISSDLGAITTSIIPNEELNDWLGLRIIREGDTVRFELGHNTVKIKNDVLSVLGQNGKPIYKTKVTKGLLELLFNKVRDGKFSEEAIGEVPEYIKLAELTGFIFSKNIGERGSAGNLLTGGTAQKRWKDFLSYRYRELKKRGFAKHFTLDHGPTIEEPKSEADEPYDPDVEWKEVKGQGLMPSNPESLFSMLNLRLASYKAGNHALRNEIIDIADELRRQKRINDNKYKSISKFIEDGDAKKIRKKVRGRRVGNI